MAYLYKNGSKWRIVVQSTGDRKNMGLGENYKKAKDAKAIIENNCEKRAFRTGLLKGLIDAGILENGFYKIKNESIVTWAEARKKLIAHLKSVKRSKSTIETYKRVFTSIEGILNPDNPSDISYKDADKWIGNMCSCGGKRKNNLSFSSINTRISIAKSGFKKFKLWKYIDENPFDYCSMLPRAMTLPNSLMKEEVKKLLESSGKVLKRALRILISTGMRPDEYYNLTWKRVVYGKWPYIHISKDGDWKPKCNVERKIPLTKEARMALGRPGRADSLVMGATEYGYRVNKPLLERRLRKAVEEAGLKDKKISFYSMRDTYATNLAIEGFGAHVIAARMGHRSLNTSMKYVSLANINMVKRRKR